METEKFVMNPLIIPSSFSIPNILLTGARNEGFLKLNKDII